MELKKVLSALSVVLVCSCSTPSHEAYKSKGERWDDREALSEIRYNLRGIRGSRGIQVSIDRGIVQLSGFVESEVVRENALREALKTKNVKDVIDNIIVRSDFVYRDERAAAAALDVK